MPSLLESATAWFEEQVQRTFGSVLELLVGSSVGVRTTSVAPAGDDTICYAAVSESLGPVISISGALEAWAALVAAIEGAPSDDPVPTSLEAASQVVSALARIIGERLGVELEVQAKSEGVVLPGRMGVALQLEPGKATFQVGLSDALWERLAVVFEPQPPVPAAESRGNLDILLDVELPITVSFGRANLPLKDVMKLSAGSIVELNRSISEPVELIVNECVVARGEVVVVEGNYGIRITQILSKQERLKTIR